jgi:pimeloyl-ACP methyl ester carboxylesterase
MLVEPFKVSVPQNSIDDLQRRLEFTRWPERETVGDWSQGVPLEKAQALIAYWRNHYDWRQFESRVNALPQYRTQIDGLGIHFIHARSPHENALPIILTHGWPGSFVEFMEVINPLTDPTRFGGRAEDAFHVVVPSLPGFAFSEKPAEAGWGIDRIARAWATLMRRLSYDRWVAQGGDWGARVTHHLAQLRPQGLIAVHVNWQFVFPEKLPDNPTSAERRAMARASWFASDQGGYFREQATRPQTIGYPLADSAAGQALWIYEKFQAWTDNQGDPEDALSVDAMLDNISLYWFTNTAGSSARIYWESARAGLTSFTEKRIELPMAASVFPREIFCPPKAWAEALWPNLFYWSELDKGGHFAAFEQPKVFTEEMRKAFRSWRTEP